MRGTVKVGALGSTTAIALSKVGANGRFLRVACVGQMGQFRFSGSQIISTACGTTASPLVEGNFSGFGVDLGEGEWSGVGFPDG